MVIIVVISCNAGMVAANSSVAPSLALSVNRLTAAAVKPPAKKLPRESSPLFLKINFYLFKQKATHLSSLFYWKTHYIMFLQREIKSKSSMALPTNCIPMGIPDDDFSIGKDNAGSPAKLNGTVIKSPI